MQLTIERVTRSYKDKIAVNNFSAEFKPGVYGLIGPNGSGKTTLIRIIVDVLKPDRGRVLFDGMDISIMDDSYRELIGYLPQNFGYYSNFTAEMFLGYIAALKGLDKNEAQEKISQTLGLVNMKDHRYSKVKTLSGGMKQRLGIAQALLNDPSILILDEPTAGLDPKERIRLRNLISEISDEKIVILSTHIISDIEYIGSEVLLMKEGALKKREKSSEILASLEGKVWLVNIEDHQLHEFQEKFRIGNIIRRESCLEITAISDIQPTPGAVPAKPKLEDIYLYHYEEGLRENDIVQV